MVEYNAVIFDFFGTLTKGHCAPEDKIISEWQLDQRLGFKYNKIEDVVCGTACETPFTEKRSSEYFQTLIKELGLPLDSEERLKEIFEKDIESEKLIKGVPEIIAYVGNKGYKLGMISDLPNPDYDLARKKFRFDHWFDFRHLSYNPDWVKNLKEGQGILKPEPAIFERTVERLGTNYENTLMIGNNLKTDIEPARKLGMRAILADYHNKNPNNPDRIENLEELRDIL